MRHKIRGRKFGRYTAHRTSMFRNLCKSLIQHGSIKTTLPKAKDLRPIIEKLVTLGKRGANIESALAVRRQLISLLGGDYPEVQKLVSEISPKY